MTKIGLAPWLAMGFLAALPMFGDAPQAQQPPVPPVPATGARTPTFSTSVNLVTSDVIVRNRRGQFQADLTKDDFEVLEDGIQQELNSFTLVHGGRVYATQTAVAAAPVREGIILPPSRPVNDTAGRVLLFVIDDLHMVFRDTHRIRRLFRDMAKELVHEGDLFGIVSTGTSSIAIDLTYDRTRMEEAANKITGGGLKPSEIIQQSSMGETPQEVMHRANVAFSTVYDMLTKLEQTHNRRKAVVLISNGYDFDPFASSRAGTAGVGMLNNRNVDPNDPYRSQVSMRDQFNDADLSMRLVEITRLANRANATFYTFDPRGLVAGQDIDEPVEMTEWEQHLRKQQDTLRIVAELTGGVAVVNTNDFSKALKRIDAETSDYYVLGYYSTNPDPTQRRRQIEIRIKKKDPDGGNLEVMYRREYSLKAPPAAAKPR
ncbi:MAG TPA: VWA domain-containing protein [Vicinamibacterales bacterium]|nr:VWA domain-containing protein [Vicinamibacterales bacterium]